VPSFESSNVPTYWLVTFPETTLDDRTTGMPFLTAFFTDSNMALSKLPLPVPAIIIPAAWLLIKALIAASEAPA
jgi:hypothetical protein